METPYTSKYFTIRYDWGEPCKHPGCLKHITHPCEGCGRYAGQGKVLTMKPVFIKFMKEKIK